MLRALRRTSIGLAIGIAILASCHVAHGGEQPTLVFIVAGQSNAEGADSDAVEIDSFPPFVGAGATQPGVRFWYENGAAPLSSGGWIALQPELQRQILGPEVTFGRKVDACIDDPIAIIKSTWGGTNLAEDWDPDAVTGPQMYDRTIALVEAAVAPLNAAGIPWEFGGVLWQQGENDMLNSTFVAQYATNLTELIDRFRTDLGDPNLAFFVGATSDKCIWGMDFRDNMQTLRSQQLSVVAADPLVHFVDTSHLAFAINVGQLQPHYHFGTEGQLQLGEAYADAYLNTIGIDTTHQSTPFCCGDPSEVGDDVRVFIFAGQRSMEGDGAHVAQIGDHPEFATLGAPQHDVLYRYRLGGGMHTSTGWAPLGPADYLGNFGPELSFGRAVGDVLNDPVAVIKVTHSAAVMRDWLPTPSDASLPQYAGVLAYIQAALADLAGSGRNPVLEAVIWTPGEHDAWWTPFRVEYAANLQTLATQLRTDLGAPELAWIVAELPDDLLWETSKLDELDAQIQTAAAADPHLWFVDSSTIPVPPVSPTLATEGCLHLGEHLAQFFLDLVCAADTDGTGAVDVNDLLAVLNDWGTDGSANDTDVDGSGVVDVNDLLAVITGWGGC